MVKTAKVAKKCSLHIYVQKFSLQKLNSNSRPLLKHKMVTYFSDDTTKPGTCECKRNEIALVKIKVSICGCGKTNKIALTDES